MLFRLAFYVAAGLLIVLVNVTILITIWDAAVWLFGLPWWSSGFKLPVLGAILTLPLMIIFAVMARVHDGLNRPKPKIF